MSLTLPIEDWPETDRTMWTRLRLRGGPLDDRGALAHLRETSCKTLISRYGRWLQWIATTYPELLDHPPADRAEIARLRHWLQDLAHTQPMMQLMFVDGVLRILTAYDPTCDWSEHKALRKGLKYLAKRGFQKRKHGRILSSQVLLEAGIRLATDHADATPSALFRATRIRDGAIIALLAMMPIRRRSLAELEIGISIFIDAAGATIALSEEQTKTGLPWEAELPPQVLPVFRQYVDEARPLLLERSTEPWSHLWINRNGVPMSYDHIGPCVATRVKEMTGIRVPPHFFRDAAATTLARISPQAAKLIRPILGHRSFGTADKHYIHAQTIEAGRDYASLIADMKGAAR
ncbi:tyrosine-type recombinase/integrase [Litorisediminicola beolgyonensis]|uniref:Tyrosine-type recombinase/integrase n=1 Tax=Litorisediminicola beolgyonensis TaxID=1173614 RepID=A0ABW3ZJI1_9RHOB